ncbi:hypothetical protein K438DRAFT_1818178 [Mycena galopus ATCC 62051]|nr:hypothetical protein K438DRAFT_1818178 [Mycena galopus ATCC 62051]
MVHKAAKGTLKNADFAILSTVSAESKSQPPSYHVPSPCLTSHPKEKALRALILRLGENLGQTRAYLTQLGQFASELGDEIRVFSSPIMFADDTRKRAAYCSYIPFQPYATVDGLLRCSRGSSTITMGLAVSTGEKSVGMTLEKWMAIPRQVNLILLIHAPVDTTRESPGKALVIGDLNIHSNSNKLDGLVSSGMVRLVQHAVNGAPKLSTWVNDRREERDTHWISLTLMLEWMLEIVIGGAHGLGIERDDIGRFGTSPCSSGPGEPGASLKGLASKSVKQRGCQVGSYNLKYASFPEIPFSSYIYTSWP